MTELTVLIPTHGRPSLLARTLSSVAACARPPGYAGCVVVENGPASGAEGAVAAAAAAAPEAGFRYLHHGRSNKSAALNAALAGLSASGPGAHLAVFFDDDVRVSPGALSAYAEAAAAHPSGAFFGGPVACDYEAKPDADLLPLFPRSVQGYELDDRGVMADEYLGFNWAAWVPEVVSAGGFDPSYGPGSATGARGQESEMQRRLRDAGARSVFVPTAEVYHYVPVARCSPGWAIRRAYHSATRLGRLARRGRGRRNVKGAVFGLIRHPLGVIAGVLRTDARVRTESLASLASDLGYLKGFFLSSPPRS